MAVAALPRQGAPKSLTSSTAQPRGRSTSGASRECHQSVDGSSTRAGSSSHARPTRRAIPPGAMRSSKCRPVWRGGRVQRATVLPHRCTAATEPPAVRAHHRCRSRHLERCRRRRSHTHSAPKEEALLEIIHRGLAARRCRTRRARAHRCENVNHGDSRATAFGVSEQVLGVDGQATR